MENRKIKLAVIASHPIEYQVLLFRQLAKDPALDLTVYFCWDYGLKETYDEGYGQKIKLDSGLLLGYRYIYLKNYSLRPSEHFLGQINPGIIGELKKNRYDAILVHGYVFFATWLAFLGAWLSRTPIILRGEADLQKPSNFAKKSIKKIVLPILFKGMTAFLYSYGLNKEYYRFYGVPEKKLFFLPCAVDNDFFQARAKKYADKKSDVRKNLGLLHPEWPTVIFVAQMIPRKRPLDLLQAFEFLQGVVDFNLIIVGDGGEISKIKKFIKEKRLVNVYLTGLKNQEERSAFYSIADILVLTSEFDPSPKALNEGMNFGLAVIATNRVGTALDLVVAGGSGYTYPVGDIEALAAKLKEIIRNGELRARFQKNALATVKQWSYEEDAKGVLAALKSLKQR